MRPGLSRAPTRENGDQTGGTGWLLTLACEAIFSLIVAGAAYDLCAARWPGIWALAAAALAGWLTFSLALFTLVNARPVREAIKAFSARYGEDPADRVFLLYLPMSIVLLAQSAGIAVAIGGHLSPTLLRACLWGLLQILALLPGLLAATSGSRWARLPALAGRFRTRRQ